jgi:hypothetical protein
MALSKEAREAWVWNWRREYHGRFTMVKSQEDFMSYIGAILHFASIPITCFSERGKTTNEMKSPRVGTILVSEMDKPNSPKHKCEKFVS